MLLNAAEMQSYLQHAFDHFSRTLDEAFDFVQASVYNNPIPLDFGGNILRLALNIMDHQKKAKRGERYCALISDPTAPSRITEMPMRLPRGRAKLWGGSMTSPVPGNLGK